MMVSLSQPLHQPGFVWCILRAITIQDYWNGLLEWTTTTGFHTGFFEKGGGGGGTSDAPLLPGSSAYFEYTFGKILGVFEGMHILFAATGVTLLL